MANATSVVIETFAARLEVVDHPDWGVSARIIVDVEGEERRIRAVGFINEADEAVAYLTIGGENFSLKKFALARAARAARLKGRADTVTPAAPAAPAPKRKKAAAALRDEV